MDNKATFKLSLTYGGYATRTSLEWSTFNVFHSGRIWNNVQMQNWAESPTNRETNRQIETDRHTYIDTDRQTEIYTNRQADRDRH